jgi:L-lactate dehydrogenase
MSKLKPGKVAIIGCGFVGSASAFALMQSGLFTEMVLLDANHQKAEGEAEDIVHGIPFGRPMQIYAGDYDDIADAAIIVITAGANQKPDETRLDLVNKNIAIFQSIIPEITKRDFEGILLIVANPVDILTYTAQKLRLSGKPGNWFRNCAGFCQTEVSSGTASGSGQQKCTCFYRGRTRGQ